MLPFLWRFTLLSLFTASVHAADFKVDAPVEVLWGGTWYKAKVIAVDAGKWKISYEGYGNSWDEFVGPERIRARGAREAAPPASAPAAPGTAAARAAAAPIPATAALTFPQRPAGKRAGLDGAYLRVETWYFNGRMSLTNQGWFFTKEGRVSLSPAGGFDFAAFKTATTAQKSDGVYWIENDTLTILWAETAKPQTYKIEIKDNEIQLDGIGATRVEGFKRAWRADATYEGGASLVGSGSYIASSDSLAFRRDGTFGGDAIGSMSSTSSGSTVSGGSSSSTSGTYEFDGFSLTLKYADGSVERRTVFAFSDRDSQGAPEYIWREGTMLRHQETKK